jgi:hypothetical protein
MRKLQIKVRPRQARDLGGPRSTLSLWILGGPCDARTVGSSDILIFALTDFNLLSVGFTLGNREGYENPE